MAPHSRIFAWKIPWGENPGRLQSMGQQRVMTTGLFFGRLRDCGRQKTPFLKGTQNFTWSGTQCRSNNLKGAKVRLTC